MRVAQHATLAFQGLLVQLSGVGEISLIVQHPSQIVHGVQGVRVRVAQNAALTFQGLLLQRSSGGEISLRAQRLR